MSVVDLPHMLAIAVVSIGAICDIRSRKIPNLLTISGMVLGIVANCLTSGCHWGVILLSAGGCLLGFLLLPLPDLIASFSKRQSSKSATQPLVIGGGDAKLLAAVGACFNPTGVLVVFIYFGILVGLHFALKREAIRSTTQASDTAEKLKEMKKSHMIMGPYIAAATIITTLIGKQTEQFLGFF